MLLKKMICDIVVINLAMFTLMLLICILYNAFPTIYCRLFEYTTQEIGKTPTLFFFQGIMTFVAVTTGFVNRQGKCTCQPHQAKE